MTEHMFQSYEYGLLLVDLNGDGRIQVEAHAIERYVSFCSFTIQ